MEEPGFKSRKANSKLMAVKGSTVMLPPRLGPWSQLICFMPFHDGSMLTQPTSTINLGLYLFNFFN